jgi:hypothetical protein
MPCAWGDMGSFQKEPPVVEFSRGVLIDPRFNSALAKSPFKPGMPPARYALIRAHPTGTHSTKAHNNPYVALFSLFLLNPDWLRKISGPRNCVMTRTQKPPLSLPSKSTSRCATARPAISHDPFAASAFSYSGAAGCTSRPCKGDVAISDETLLSTI